MRLRLNLDAGCLKFKRLALVFKLPELLNLDFKSRAKRSRACANSASRCTKALKFLAQNGIKMIEKLIQKSKNITAAGRSDIEPAWIAQAQRRLGAACELQADATKIR